MKARFLLLLASLLLLFASQHLLAVDLRADDPLPPIPPGSPLPPPLPATSTPNPPSQSPSQQGPMKSPGLMELSSGQTSQRLQKLKQELGLTPAQVVKIKPIFDKAGAQLKALRDNTSLPAQQKRQRVRQVFAASAQQIRPILTPQQLQKWKQIRQEHRTTAAST